MPHKTFFAFILPSLIAMVLFIALPIVSVVVQSFYVEHGRILVEVENCQPFGGCGPDPVPRAYRWWGREPSSPPSP